MNQPLGSLPEVMAAHVRGRSARAVEGDLGERSSCECLLQVVERNGSLSAGQLQRQAARVTVGVMDAASGTMQSGAGRGGNATGHGRPSDGKGETREVATADRQIVRRGYRNTPLPAVFCLKSASGRR